MRERPTWTQVDLSREKEVRGRRRPDHQGTDGVRVRPPSVHRQRGGVSATIQNFSQQGGESADTVMQMLLVSGAEKVVEFL